MDKNNKEKKPADWLMKARESWDNTGSKRPPFAIVPKKGQRSVWDFPRPPSIERVDKPVMVSFGETEIANSRRTLAVMETASPPTYYIPKNDVNMHCLAKVYAKSSLCEWKGRAIYWTLKETTGPLVAWSYPNPFSEFEALREHIAFYPQHLDCFVDGNKVLAQASPFYAGWITPDLTGPFKGEKGTEHW